MCTPSYALYLADAIKDSGLPREEFRLKIGAFGAEPWTENMRNEIEEKLEQAEIDEQKKLQKEEKYRE